MKEMKVKSPMAAPKLEKIVINVGVADAREDIKFMTFQTAISVRFMKP